MPTIAQFFDRVLSLVLPPVLALWLKHNPAFNLDPLRHWSFSVTTPVFIVSLVGALLAQFGPRRSGKGWSNRKYALTILAVLVLFLSMLFLYDHIATTNPIAEWLIWYDILGYASYFLTFTAFGFLLAHLIKYASQEAGQRAAAKSAQGHPGANIMRQQFWELVHRYGERYTTAAVYGFFTVLSCLVALALFGLLHSTGIMKVVFADFVKEAEFGGAFSGFLVTLIWLVWRYDLTSPGGPITLSGNVFTKEGLPVEGATVFVEGLGADRRTDQRGWFSIEVRDHSEWTIIAQAGSRTTRTTVKREDRNKPVRLELAAIARIEALPPLATPTLPAGGSTPTLPAGGSNRQTSHDRGQTAPPLASPGMGHMGGKQIEALRDALCAAFDRSSLNQMIRIRLDKDLDKIVAPGDLNTVVFDLINVALQEGWLSDLITAAARERPQNEALQRFLYGPNR
jgi:hypothetical protein